MARDSDAEDIAPEYAIDANHVRIAATFVDDEAPKLHPTFGGAPSFDPDSGHFRCSMKFETLAVALRDYVPASLRVDVGPNTPKIEWDGLFDQINSVEEEAHGTEHGPRAIFCSLALKIGENKEVIDPWISLIPNEYGLAVVKCAVAVMLNAAEKYAEERQKLFDALIEIRETIGEASSKTKSFQQESEISKCAETLYEAIVTAIQDILQSLPTQKPPTERRRLLPKWVRRKDADLKNRGNEDKDAKGSDGKTVEVASKAKKEAKQKRKKIDIDAVLEGAREAAKDLDRAVDEWKTRTMLKTGEYSKDTNEQVAVILGWVVTEADPIIKDTNAKAEQIQAQLRQAEQRQTTDAKEQSRKMDRILQLTENFSKIQARGAAKEALLEMALAEAKKENSNLKKKMRLLEKQRQRGVSGIASRSDTPRAVLTLEQLLKIMLDLSFDQERMDRQIFDIDSMLERLNDGLDTVLKRRARVNPHDQGQAQSLFQETDFLTWLEGENPDMILIDGNMESASRNKVSAMSLFCANFVLTMTTLESQDVYTHFFCGCHNSHMDPWQGPKGLLQSVIIQLLAVLDARGHLSLDFLSTRSQVKELEKGDIDQLCRVFHQLVNEFPPGTTVYCIIDGIQFFCREPYLPDCDILVRHLRAVVKDDQLKPKFKVLMTVPFRSPRQLKKMAGDMRYTQLRAKHLSPGMITRRGFENRLGQRSTPSPSPLSRRRSRDAWVESERASSDSSFESDSDETTD